MKKKISSDALKRVNELSKFDYGPEPSGLKERYYKEFST